MSAPHTFPTTFTATLAALDHADRAVSAMLSRLTYAQDTSVARLVITMDGRRHAAIAVGERYVMWPSPPAPMRFGRQQTVQAESCRWHLALRGAGGALPELAELGRHEGLKAALKALVRELLADRFLPMRHRVASSPARGPATAAAGAGSAQSSRPT